MALTDMADARHHDLSIYVEDTVAAQLVLLALDQDLRRRVEVKAIGSNTEFPAVARFLRNAMPDQRFLFVLDGDTKQNIINGMFRDAGTPPPGETNEPLSMGARPLTTPERNHWIALLPSDQPPEQWMISELLRSDVGPQALADQLNLSSPEAAVEHLHRLSTLPDKHTAFTESERLLYLPPGSACHAFIKALYRAQPELRRQIASLYYERSELSINKQKLAEQTHASSDQRKSQLTVRDPYVFEFLGLRPQEVVSESHLESQLLDKLQAFLIELGQGFCFEARQRRILIGDTFYFVDLVFYHRLLKCHVLVDLKLEAFSHENIGQLNTYVTWYNRQVRAPDDNPPIGILLCTERDRALVQYALAGMDNELFVSKYELQLPDRETLQLELEAERRRLEQGE